MIWAAKIGKKENGVLIHGTPKPLELFLGIYISGYWKVEQEVCWLNPKALMLVMDGHWF